MFLLFFFLCFSCILAKVEIIDMSRETTAFPVGFLVFGFRCNGEREREREREKEKEKERENTQLILNKTKYNKTRNHREINGSPAGSGFGSAQESCIETG